MGRGMPRPHLADEDPARPHPQALFTRSRSLISPVPSSPLCRVCRATQSGCAKSSTMMVQLQTVCSGCPRLRGRIDLGGALLAAVSVPGEGDGEVAGDAGLGDEGAGFGVEADAELECDGVEAEA